MDIVFCADRKVVPGLHVAAWSLLKGAGNSCLPLCFHLFSDELDNVDCELLKRTLSRTGNPFELILHRIDPKLFTNFPPLNKSWATYYRLHAAVTIDAERLLYVDTDTLCDTDVAPLLEFDFSGNPAAWVPEAPIADAVDRGVAEELRASPSDFYFNAGVMLINTSEWRSQRISERAMEYIAQKHPTFHDQSALNIVLHRNSVHLDERFNTICNMRKHWPLLRNGTGQTGRLIHFVDYPKPWDFLGEFVSPYHGLWRTAAEQTQMVGFRSWRKAPSRRLPRSKFEFRNYKKALKDRLLFNAYRRGIIKTAKGIN